eukprot:7319926-Ditylum_brightwellii.AAC.1
MAPTSTQQSNRNVKQAVIAFPRPTQGSSNAVSSTPTSYAPPLQTQLHPSTSSLYLSLTRELLRSGSSSNMVSKQ